MNHSNLNVEAKTNYITWLFQQGAVYVFTMLVCVFIYVLFPDNCTMYVCHCQWLSMTSYEFMSCGDQIGAKTELR